jgi:hypothetical protein
MTDDIDRTWAFFHFLKLNYIRVLATNLLLFFILFFIGAVIFFSITNDMRSSPTSVFSQMGMFLAIFIGVVFFGNYFAFASQRNTIAQMKKDWTLKDLEVSQTRKFKLKTKYNRAFYLCKMSLGAVPNCKIVDMDPKHGTISAKRGDLLLRGPACAIQYRLVRKGKKVIKVEARSDLFSILGLSDRGHNYKNLDYMMRYLNRHCKETFVPVDFGMEDEVKRPEWLTEKPVMRPDYLEDE